MTSTQPRLIDRLRWPPVSSTVKGSLPVLFFGDLEHARVATIGLNPSRQEYLSPNGKELEGPVRRFETLASLRATDRPSMTNAQCNQAIQTMSAYFGPTKPVYSWFRSLARVVEGLGASFVDGSAAHLDLVQEATDPTWSSLPKQDREDLVLRDLAFLRWQIEAFDLRVLVCTSATVLDRVLPLVNAVAVSGGQVARVRWKVAHGRADGRPVGVVGWNIPLARPTGLDIDGQRRLGSMLRDQLGPAIGM